MISSQKSLGQYFTPPDVAETLCRWAVQHPNDRLLDPSCGDGAFLVHHERTVGVEFCEDARASAGRRAPHATIHRADFFDWAAATTERFEAIAGNPPFIRYQRFNGSVREKALSLARQYHADFSGLTSSWAPFLVAASSLLKSGGRIAFVTPAEIGHATYSQPLLQFLMDHFGFVVVVAIREKLFPQLSEDAWLLYADGFGESTGRIGLAVRNRFTRSAAPPRPDRWISAEVLRQRNFRMRRYLLPTDILSYFDDLSGRNGVVELGSLARVGIGYVTGDNDFFHLRPSQVAEWQIPKTVLRVAVRNGGQMGGSTVSKASVRRWLKADQGVLLLDLASVNTISPSIERYLDSEDGMRARERYKCRVRNPWYAVPNVKVPDAFLTYLNGREPDLVANKAECVCTNSLLTVHLTNGTHFTKLQSAWQHPLSRLSQELEGHPLGGGLLKLEPGEAARVRIPLARPRRIDRRLLEDGIALMRRWRHHE
jgi:adenine-specific DNA-methyltransferase